MTVYYLGVLCVIIFLVSLVCLGIWLYFREYHSYWKGSTLTILSGKAAGESRQIVSYNSKTATYTVDKPFTDSGMNIYCIDYKVARKPRAHRLDNPR